jgi:hypothetical protein
MVFNATFKNISVISWQSVFLIEETGENPPRPRVQAMIETFTGMIKLKKNILKNILAFRLSRGFHFFPVQSQSEHNFVHTSNVQNWLCMDRNISVGMLCHIGLLVFNATFNNISVISWRSVLLVEETTDLPQVTDKLYHIKLHRVQIY